MIGKAWLLYVFNMAVSEQHMTRKYLHLRRQGEALCGESLHGEAISIIVRNPFFGGLSWAIGLGCDVKQLLERVPRTMGEMVKIEGIRDA